MENTKVCTMDEHRRILLPASLYTQLGWERGSKITAQICTSSRSVELRATDKSGMIIDDLSRVKLDKEFCAELAWRSAEISISVAVDIINSLIRLSQIDPSEPTTSE